MYGGGSSQRRQQRLMSSAPYASRQPKKSSPPSTQPPPAQQRPSHTDGMSSTARFILDALEKMSTPLRDAQKIPVVPNRSERRKQIAQELDSTLETPSRRRRPRLGGAVPAGGAGLNGPPLRTVFSPVSVAVREQPKRSVEPKNSEPITLTPRSEPLPTNTASSSCGKVRAKVGDKARQRAEKSLLDMTPPASVNLPSGSPLKLKSLPVFSFTPPPPSAPPLVSKPSPPLPQAQPKPTILAANQSVLTSVRLSPPPRFSFTPPDSVTTSLACPALGDFSFSDPQIVHAVVSPMRNGHVSHVSGHVSMGQGGHGLSLPDLTSTGPSGAAGVKHMKSGSIGKCRLQS